MKATEAKWLDLRAPTRIQTPAANLPKHDVDAEQMAYVAEIDRKAGLDSRGDRVAHVVSAVIVVALVGFLLLERFA